jgi:hypothetical protein
MLSPQYRGMPFAARWMSELMIDFAVAVGILFATEYTAVPTAGVVVPTATAVHRGKDCFLEEVGWLTL